MTTVYCAVCGNTFEGDQDHVKVEADIHRASRRASALADRSGGKRYSGM